MDSCKRMHGSLNYGFRGKRSSNVHFTGKGTLTARKWKWFAQTKPWEVPVGKPGWNSNLQAQGPFFWTQLFFFFFFFMNILATWLYFHGQFLKEIRNDLFSPSDFKIGKLFRIAKLCAFKECAICCQIHKAKVNSSTICLLQQSWWHCCSHQTGRRAHERLTQGFQKPKVGLRRLGFLILGVG